jgi:hypothetical protein
MYQNDKLIQTRFHVRVHVIPEWGSGARIQVLTAVLLIIPVL